MHPFLHFKVYKMAFSRLQAGRLATTTIKLVQFELFKTNYMFVSVN